MTGLQRNGYAAIADLDTAELREMLSQMENFQLDFIAKTASIWTESFPFTGDSLYTWSRQWEYPYHLANLGISQGRILDAGSGITFFPFFLARQGFTVYCCDNWAILERPFRDAQMHTGLPVQFECASITHLSQPDGFFDAVCCVSVLEHLSGADRQSAIREFHRVLRPKGHLVLTCDISLGRDSDMRVEEFAVLLHDLLTIFEPVYPLDMRRGSDLLTTDYFRSNAAWRLPWRPRPRTLRNWVKRRIGQTEFHAVAIIGLTLLKPQ